MTTLWVLNVDDFRPLAEVAAGLPGVAVKKRGPYYEVTGNGPIEINRDNTGCRNAVWYSAVAAVSAGRVSRWDKAVLRIEPLVVGMSTGPSTHASRGDFVAKDSSAYLARDVT